jgi:hypothetical protein
VTRRQTLSPVNEIMPERCTLEHERVVAKMAASLPYRRARALLSEFLPLDDIPSAETTRRRTIRVGARLEQEAAAACSGGVGNRGHALNHFATLGTAVVMSYLGLGRTSGREIG